MVTLVSCDHSSGSRNGWLIEWWKVNTLCGVMKARTIIALAPEGRQKIVVFATVVIYMYIAEISKHSVKFWHITQNNNLHEKVGFLMHVTYTGVLIGVEMVEAITMLL